MPTRPATGQDDATTSAQPRPLPLDAAKWSAVARGLRLSRQQRRVVELILRGMRDKQVAAALGLTVPTVRSHLTRIFAKTGTADRVELVLRVFAASEAAGCGRCQPSG